jgi:hypothetical protein
MSSPAVTTPDVVGVVVVVADLGPGRVGGEQHVAGLCR